MSLRSVHILAVPGGQDLTVHVRQAAPGSFRFKIDPHSGADSQTFIDRGTEVVRSPYQILSSLTANMTALPEMITRLFLSSQVISPPRLDA